MNWTTNLGQSSSGVVTGRFNAADGENDVLTYAVVTAPSHGAVTVSADGSYTYTPSQSVAFDGTTDSFSVTVSDAGSGFHLHGLGGLLNLLTFGLLGLSGHTATATVPLTVTAWQHHTLTATATVGTPETNTGVVLGQVIASTSDGGPLSYSAPTTTAKGSVNINTTTGAFSYTPSDTARHTAAATDATETERGDIFSVTITNRYGAFTTVSVAVEITPANIGPVVGTPTVGTPDATTGLVTGNLVATDADKDSLEFTLTVNPAKGAVTIIASTGSFTYTPTTVARENAGKVGASPSDRVDGFTVMATDGHGGSTSSLVSVPISPKPLPSRWGDPHTYTTFEGASVGLFKYPGQRIMILGDSNSLDASTMLNWVSAIDAAYNFYRSCTGRDPSPANPTYIDGLATIARVHGTCGAGCGYLGWTGIEILNTYFNNAYSELRDFGQYDQIPFYELGRNFWFYSKQLAYAANDPVTTGYAVFMRFIAMEQGGISGAPFGGVSFADFENQVRNLRLEYLGDSSRNWSNTLGVGQGVASSGPLALGASDLFASFCFYLKETYGMRWVENVWKYAAALPDAMSTQDAVDNFVIAASRASNTDLVSLFEYWRWPVSSVAIDAINSLSFVTKWRLSE